MIQRDESLRYHATGRPGKIELRPRKPCLTPREMRLAYLPGAVYPAAEIAADPAAVFRYTARGNLVAVVTNGTAVPGLGEVGPRAAKPMQEGIAVLFKRLADIDVFDLELDTGDPEQIVETIRLLEPSFGGINLKDMRAPLGLEIYERAARAAAHPRVPREPVQHRRGRDGGADQRARARGETRRRGAGRALRRGHGRHGLRAAAAAPGRGARAPRRLRPAGPLAPGARGPAPYQRAFCQDGPPRRWSRESAAPTCSSAPRRRDTFSVEMIRSMARFPIVLALATPEPEIGYEAARASRRDVIVATSQDLHPNAVLDLLSFPYVFRGALDVQATRITEGMLLAAARALADLAREDVVEEVERAYGRERFSFGPEYLLPKAIDPRILVRESAAVAQQAVAEGVAGRPLERVEHEASLQVRLGTGRETLRGLMLRARRSGLRVVFADGTHETILRACGILLDEGIASPILLGDEDEIGRAVERLGLELRGIQVVDPARSPRCPAYVERYLGLRRRRGVMRSTAERRVAEPDHFAAMMVHGGDADMMIAGIDTHYAESLRTILEVIGPAPGVRRISSHYLVLLPKDVLCLADCAVNIDPTAEELAEIAILAARTARALGLEPRVAMLSFSNFGSVDHPTARKVREAALLARRREPELAVDGEMQLAVARDAELRRRHFPFSASKARPTCWSSPTCSRATWRCTCCSTWGRPSRSDRC